jgi:acyl-CoA synthetase (AMP-forming)/AMP-acid ligase II
MNGLPVGAERGHAYGVGGDALLREPIWQVLMRRAASHADRVALWWLEQGALSSMTYAELAESANSVAHRLRGLAPGSRVAIWARNTPEWVLIEYACAARGLVLVPLNTAWTDHEASYAVELTAPSLIFAGLDGRGAPLYGRAATLSAGVPVEELEGLLDLPRTPPAAAEDVAPDNPFIIQFTSGTTGQAKGATITQFSALNCAYLRLRHSAGDRDVSMNAVPFHHIGGAVSIILGALSTGGSFIVMPKFDEQDCVRLLHEARVTHMGGVPTMVERLLAHPGIADRASALAVVGLGGADISPDLVRRINTELGAAVMTTYAQSECPFITNSVAGDDPEVIATTAGRPGDATTIRIVDPTTGAVLDFGETGEVQVRSPLVMLGYYGMPERTVEVLPGDGFLRTGDLGSLSSDGYLTIRGRIREVIIRGGENIYPAEVEAALGTHPDVMACAVVGLADPAWGETVAASVIATRPGIAARELEGYLGERLAHFKIPRTWRFVDVLPMTASGKIRRVEVRDTMNRETSNSVQDSER